MKRWRVTIPATEVDPDLIVADKDGTTKPVEFPFLGFWATVMQSDLWDKGNDSERITIACALQGRCPKPSPKKANDRCIGLTFDLTKDERTHVLDVMAKMDLAPMWRNLVRQYRLSVLCAAEVEVETPPVKKAKGS